MKSAQLIPAVSDTLPPEQIAVMQLQQRLAQECSAPKPFYLVRLRNHMLSIARQFYSSQNLFDFAQAESDMPKVPGCLFYSSDSQARTLEVEPMFSAQPPETEKPSIFVGLSAAQFSRVSLDDGTKHVSNTLHIEEKERKCRVSVVFKAQHTDGDIATFLLELLQTHLEGSRLKWMQQLGLYTFDTTSISPVETVNADSRRILRAELVCSVEAHITISTTEQSLPLREVRTVPSTVG